MIPAVTSFAEVTIDLSKRESSSKPSLEWYCLVVTAVLVATAATELLPLPRFWWHNKI